MAARIPAGEPIRTRAVGESPPAAAWMSVMSDRLPRMTDALAVLTGLLRISRRLSTGWPGHSQSHAKQCIDSRLHEAHVYRGTGLRGGACRCRHARSGRRVRCPVRLRAGGRP